MRKAALAERENPARAAVEERQAEAVAREIPTKARPPGAGELDEILSLFRDRMGLDLSSVRLRTNDEGARAFRANAYTVGKEIAFAKGQYAPHTEEGQRLIAHELTHVAQQAANGRLTVQRQPSTVDPATLTPESRLLLAEENMGRVAADFAAALASVDERRVTQAGLMVVAQWDNADLAAREIVPLYCSPDTAVCQTYNLEENQQQTFDGIKRTALRALTLQRLGARMAVFGAEEVTPVASEDVSAQLLTQLRQVAWVVKDTAALITILDQDEVPATEQWTAIGLLRQHMNPIQFSWMVAAADEAGVGSAFDAFEQDQMDAYYALVGATEGMMAAGLGDDPTAEAPAYQVLPAQRKVRLLQPLTMEELSDELYGSRSAWRRALVPYNRGILEGIGETTWLPTGTELNFEAGLANAGVQTMVAASDAVQAQLQRAGTEPVLTSDAHGQPASIGNTVAFSVHWVATGDEWANVTWWAENDPIAIRDAGVPERLDGSTYSLSQGIDTTTWNLEAVALGSHTVHADVTMPDGTVRNLSMVQVVMTPEERMEVGEGMHRDDPFRPEGFLERLVAQRDAASGERREQLDRQIEAIRENLEDMKGPDGSHGLRSITAIYVSTTGAPVTARLNVYAGRDPSWFDSRDSHYHLIDFTLGAASQYSGSGSRNNQGVENLLRGFADDAPYPDGFIRFPNINQVDTYGGSGSLTFPTDGGDMTVSILRALSMVSLGVGVVASLALQPEVAIPAFWIAGALAGTAGGVDIYQRLERGEFEWDLQTGMDLLDIAGAVVSMGASSAASTTIRGVGRFSLRGSIQTGIGVAQIGVMGGVHVAQIAAAVESGDDAAIARAVAHAIADGALILIVHRASARLSEPRPSSSAPETRRTTSGTGSSEPPPRVTETGTPERTGAPQTAHDQWVSDMLRSGMGERPNAPAEPRPIGPEPEIRTGDAAYAEYERTLAETGYEIEVAIYRNRATGEYRVRRGTAMEVSGPMGEGWEGVMHYHPNPGNVLTYRMPAPADINGVAMPAFRARAPITEFVEYPLPGGGRGRAAYTLDPRTGGVSIEYQRADGSRYRRSYASLNDYTAEYNARTTYLEPGTPEYEWAMRDLNDYYRNSLGGDSSRRTTGGTTPASPPTDVALDTMSQAQFDASIDAAFAEAGFNTDHAARPPVRPLGSGGLREGARGRFNAVRDDYATQLGVASGGQVHHAVELQVIDRYPGVYTEAEINGIGNMRGIPPETSGRRQLHNSKIREVWDRHYARLDAEIARRGLAPGTPEYRTVCRRYLDSARDEIDYVMGQFFSEYRRSLFPSPPTSSAPAAPSP